MNVTGKSRTSIVATQEAHVMPLTLRMHLTWLGGTVATGMMTGWACFTSTEEDERAAGAVESSEAVKPMSSKRPCSCVMDALDGSNSMSAAFSLRWTTICNKQTNKNKTKQNKTKCPKGRQQIENIQKAGTEEEGERGVGQRGNTGRSSMFGRKGRRSVINGRQNGEKQTLI